MSTETPDPSIPPVPFTPDLTARHLVWMSFFDNWTIAWNRCNTVQEAIGLLHTLPDIRSEDRSRVLAFLLKACDPETFGDHLAASHACVLGDAVRCPYRDIHRKCVETLFNKFMDGSGDDWLNSRSIRTVTSSSDMLSYFLKTMRKLVEQRGHTVGGDGTQSDTRGRILYSKLLQMYELWVRWKMGRAAGMTNLNDDVGATLNLTGLTDLLWLMLRIDPNHAELKIREHMLAPDLQQTLRRHLLGLSHSAFDMSLRLLSDQNVSGRAARIVVLYDWIYKDGTRPSET